MKIRLLLHSFIALFFLFSGQARAQWCTPPVSTCALNYNVSFSTTGGSTNISNPNTNCAGVGGYTFYSAMTHAGVQGTVCNFSFTNQAVYNEYYVIYVDWNQDFDFTDPGETVYPVTSVSASQVVNGSFTIPLTATGGITRMRLRVHFVAATLDPCLTNYDGETEDYNFNVIPAVPCSGTPTAGTATASAPNVCANTLVTFGLTGATNASGLTYQWETAPAATGPWTAVGAPTTASNYSQVVSTTTFFRAQVICGTNSAASTPVQVTVPTLFPAGTYTINAGAPASATNFVSFNAAVSAVSCGTTGPVIFNVVAGSGPYTEQVLIPQINTNSATNTITFNGNNNTLTFPATATAMYTLGLNGADYIRVNNLNIVGTGATNALVAHLWGGANNNNFVGCSFTAPANGTSTLQVPFSISGTAVSGTSTGLGGDSNLVSGCTIANGYYNTTIIGNSGTLTSKGNKIVDCNIKDFYFYGIYNFYAEGTTFSNNNIERLTRTNSSTCYAIYLTTGSVNVLCEKNKIHDVFANPVTTSSSYLLYCLSSGAVGLENRLINNTMYNIKSNGLVYAIYIPSYSNYKIHHNTLALDDVASTATGATYGIYCTGGSNVDIKNNIVSITRGGAGTKYCLYYTGGLQTSNYNILHMNASGTTAIGYSGVIQPTLANWQAATSQDMNSYSGDPIFMAPATGNLKPLQLLMNNKGTPVGVTTDIVNVTRSATVPDIGAFEFGDTPPLCITTPVAPANGSTTVCSGLTTLRWNAAPGAASYDVYFNSGTAAPTTIVSASQIDTFYTVTTTMGAYTWRIIPKNTYGAPTGCGFWAFSTVPSVTATAVASVLPNDTICANDLATFTATITNGGPTPFYQWKKNNVNVGTNSPVYTDAGIVNNDEIKVVMTTSLAACVSDPSPVSNMIKMTVITMPPATIAGSGPIAFCNGGNITLSTTTTGSSYQWQLNGGVIAGATSNSYVAALNGLYRVAVKNVGQLCPSYSDTFRVTVYPTPFPLVNRTGMTLSTETFYDTYQWYYNGQPIPGATSATYTITRDGRYYVKVTDMAGCGGTSITTPINSLAVSTISASDISVYPNPATDLVNISTPSVLNVAVRSVDGKLVLQAKQVNQINIAGLAEGIYILHLSDEHDNLIKVEKLMKASK